MTIRLLILVAASVSLSAAAQILMKLGMSRPEVRAALNGSAHAIVAVVSAMATLPVALGLAAYAGSAVIWLFVLSRLDVSVAYPFVGLGFALVTFFGVLLFDEPLTVTRVMGTALVIAGVVLLGRP